ncbi:hypothetical protein ABEB36_015148 [Hypothenemus hampei]|uniref:Uncharacterized protein n=1 Tax=Hypothenemus hampei TaxID=57062 RepID=A0ABD1E1G1_HYPHA
MTAIFVLRMKENPHCALPKERIANFSFYLTLPSLHLSRVVETFISSGEPSQTICAQRQGIWPSSHEANEQKLKSQISGDGTDYSSTACSRHMVHIILPNHELKNATPFNFTQEFPVECLFYRVNTSMKVKQNDPVVVDSAGRVVDTRVTLVSQTP